VLVFRFRLAHAQTLRFTLYRLAPDCRPVARFRRHGHPGLNVIRIKIMTSGKRLRPGTYRITARGPARIVLRRRFVVARTRPKHAALLAALRRNTCTSNRSHAQLISMHVAEPPVTPPPLGAVAGSHVVLHAHRGTSGNHVLGELTSPLGVSPAWLKPILLAAVGLALALLTLAVLPQRTAYPSGAALVLARHRGGFAVAGVALLAAVLLAVLLT
jgi:hypothetical protein